MIMIGLTPLLFPLYASDLDVLISELLWSVTASSFDRFSLSLLHLDHLRLPLRGLADDVNVILGLGSDSVLLLLLQHLVLTPPRSSAQLQADSALSVSLDSLETLNNLENYKRASSYPGRDGDVV